MDKLLKKIGAYAEIMRLHKPIGILLLLWPTLWALWLSSNGRPNTNLIFVFISGVILMRSAGCIANDIADRKYDAFVERTQHRPLVSARVSVKEASMLCGLLILIAFVLVLTCNKQTIQLSFVGVALAFIYPWLKRITFLPQVGLGLAFSWGVPMAFSATQNTIGTFRWFLFATAAIWPVIYDTIYAMLDRKDDLKIGVKSTAILFAQMDRCVIGLLQVLFLILLIIVGFMFELHLPYFGALAIVALLFIYQQYLLTLGTNAGYYDAFANHNWVGLVIFLGIACSPHFPCLCIK